MTKKLLYGKDYLRKKKISSSSLSYALYVVLIVGILVFTLIILVAFNNRIQNKLEVESEILANFESLINYGVKNFKSLDSEFINSDFEYPVKSVLNKSKWGLIDVLGAKLVFRNDTVKKVFFVSSQASKGNSLSLLKNDKGFFLAGNSVIEGDISIPFGKINNLNLIGFPNIINHKGIKKVALHKLPKIKSFYIPNDVEYLRPDSLEEERENNFFNRTKRVQLSSNVLSNVDLSGNYILEFKGEVLIKSNNNLEDIIIISPSVTVEKGFKGVIQVFASKKIKIEDNVNLEYPSILYLKGNKEQVEIDINKNSNLSGAIIATSENNKNIINISKNSRIVGGMYCNGEIAIKGKVYGEIFANNFFLTTDEARYKNATLNLKLLSLPSFFQKIDFLDLNTETCEVIKRLN